LTNNPSSKEGICRTEQIQKHSTSGEKLNQLKAKILIFIGKMPSATLSISHPTAEIAEWVGKSTTYTQGQKVVPTHGGISKHCRPEPISVNQIKHQKEGPLALERDVDGDLLNLNYLLIPAFGKHVLYF
jgi:hypothetical protein